MALLQQLRGAGEALHDGVEMLEALETPGGEVTVTKRRGNGLGPVSGVRARP